jgi:hypothetical protein
MVNDEYTPEVEQDENENNEGQEGVIENDDENQDQNQSETKSKDDDKDWKAEALKLKAILERNKNKKHDDKPPRKSNGLDYGQKAFLVANGVKGENETKLVEEAMRETGKSLEQVLESKYFQAELNELRELENTKNATPKGSRSGGGVPTDSVEYWAQKPIEDVPQEMRIKVVNYKLEKSKQGGVFYNS